VADLTLEPASAFLHWTPIAHASLTAAPHETLTMASFAAARGKTDALAEALRAAYGLELPRRPGRAEGNGIAVVWAGLDQWLAIAERGAGRDLETELKPRLAGLASVVDQSDGRVVVRISGPRARDVLAKGLPIDLHPRAFKPGDVAITHASHIGVILWQLDERPTYELAMFRSYADSFAHWLDEAAAEYL
jgi:heterotetrameric sarcosine oxidase gamma subunit